MKKQQFEELKLKFPKELIWEFYRNHSINATAEYFELTKSIVERLIKEYELVKSNKDIENTKKQTCLDKYGVDNPAKNTDIINKAVTKRKENNSYVTGNQKAKQTILKNNASITDEYQRRADKAKETLINKYGSLEVAYQSQAETRKNTNIEKFGVENPFQSSEIKEKIKQTNQVKYGRDYANQTSDVKTKIFESKLNHFGSDNFGNWKQGHQTRIEHYGSLEESYKIGFENQKITMMERYGVECYFNSPNISSHRKKKDTLPNKKFASALKRYNIDFEQEFVLENKSYDFKIGNYLFEINPTVTHNINWSPFGEHKGIDKKYHQQKSLIAKRNGYRCIHIWDWDDIDKVIKQLLIPKPSIGARKCILKEVNKAEAIDFINQNHLQGYAKDNIRIGLYYNDELISIMTFGKPRYNKKFEYELIRYCSSYSITGGAEKIFNYFINKYNPKSIISYCDNNKFNGDVYQKLRFEFNQTILSSHWHNVRTGEHILDSLLRWRGFDQLLGKKYGYYGKGTDNEELMLLHDFVEVIDAGQSSYFLNFS